MNMHRYIFEDNHRTTIYKSHSLTIFYSNLVTGHVNFPPAWNNDSTEKEEGNEEEREVRVFHSPKDIFLEYSEYSTIQGLIYIFFAYQTIVGKIFWTIVLLLMLALGLYWCIQAYLDWQDKPVLTTITTTAYSVNKVSTDWIHTTLQPKYGNNWIWILENVLSGIQMHRAMAQILNHSAHIFFTIVKILNIFISCFCVLNCITLLSSIYRFRFGRINKPYKRVFMSRIKSVINNLPSCTYHLLYYHCLSHVTIQNWSSQKYSDHGLNTKHSTIGLVLIIWLP